MYRNGFCCERETELNDLNFFHSQASTANNIGKCERECERECECELKCSLF